MLLNKIIKLTYLIDIYLLFCLEIINNFYSAKFRYMFYSTMSTKADKLTPEAYI